MKKIFAIALAVVMVLSMASAFALTDCYTGFAWPCDPDTLFCGRGTVEVVPVVRVNNACGGYEYQINTCAGAVAGQDVYYAIRLNVEANPDSSYPYANQLVDVEQEEYWWDKATLTIVGAEGVFDPAVSDTEALAPATDDGIDWDADKAKSYYLVATNTYATTWVDVTTKNLNLKDVVFKATLAEGAKASDAEICAYIESEWDGTGTWFYGDYKVEVAVGSLKVTKGTDSVEYTVTTDADGVKTEDVKVVGDADIQAEVNKLFNLNGCTVGTCLTDKNIANNFGWDTDGELEDCFKWSAQASAIVDAECVVAIPKTGDASLLAWLF